MLELAIQFLEGRLLVGLGLAAIISLGAWRLGVLTPSGSLAASLVGGLTYGLGGLPAAILLIAFFGSSSLLSRTFTKRKAKAAADFAKGGRRDWAQVAANGGVPVLALLAGAGGLLAAPVAWVAFAAALATVSADTWATELGVLSKTPPRLITTGKTVSPGTSGGVSLLGNLVGLGAAFFIGILAWLIPLSLTIQVVLIATSAGILGSIFDSYLGALVQAIYYCPKCKKETERYPTHTCGTKTTLRRGWPWLNNDWVNFLSASAGALLATGAASIFM
jgi:uncharacterized protein (TIGR00297 family)